MYWVYHLGGTCKWEYERSIPEVVATSLSLRLVNKDNLREVPEFTWGYHELSSLSCELSSISSELLLTCVVSHENMRSTGCASALAVLRTHRHRPVRPVSGAPAKESVIVVMGKEMHQI